MTHTYETLTEELVSQYAYIWSYERLKRAYRKIDDQMCDIAAETRKINWQIINCGRNIIKANQLRKALDDKLQLLEKAKKFYDIIERELITRETPIEANTANGIYGRFE